MPMTGATDVTAQCATTTRPHTDAEIQKRSEAAAETGDVDTSLSLLAEVDQWSRRRGRSDMEENGKS